MLLTAIPSFDSNSFSSVCDFTKLALICVKFFRAYFVFSMT